MPLGNQPGSDNGGRNQNGEANCRGWRELQTGKEQTATGHDLEQVGRGQPGF